MEFFSPKKLNTLNQTPLGETGACITCIIYWLLKHPVFNLPFSRTQSHHTW